MKSVRIFQRDLLRLIRIAVSDHPIDLSKFAVRILEEELPRLKEELGLDFDELKVYPGPQPRESADVELYKGGLLVAKINVKTCVSGDLTVTVRKLKESLKPGEDGLILLFTIFEGENSHAGKTVLAYIPGDVLWLFGAQEIRDRIWDLLQKKTASEGYRTFYTVALNEAVSLIRAKEAILARETAEKALEESRRAREVAEKALEEVRQLRRELIGYLERILEKLEGK